MPAKSLKKIQNHPAATYVGDQVTLTYLGKEEIQQEIHFDHPSVGQCGVLIRRKTGLGTVKVIIFTLPDRSEWNRAARREDDAQNFDPTDMLTDMWYEFQKRRADGIDFFGSATANITTVGSVNV